MRHHSIRSLALLLVTACRTPGEMPVARESNPDLGGLKAQEVQAVIRNNLDSVRTCYDSTGVKEGVSGSLTFQFVVDKAGRMKTNQLVKDRMQIPAMESCIRTAMASWQFPEPRKGVDVTVTYPFTFDAADDVTLASQATFLQTQLDATTSCSKERASLKNLILRLRIQMDGSVHESTQFMDDAAHPLTFPCVEQFLKAVRFPVPKEPNVPTYTFYIGVNVGKKQP